MSRAFHFLRAHAATLLFSLTLCYMAWQVLLTPFIGYANNYDFFRQSACVGLWHQIDGVEKTSGNYLFPSKNLQFDGNIRDGCMRSSDNLFPYLATLPHEAGDKLQFWQVAIWKLLFIALTGAMLIVFSPVRLRLPLTLVFALVFTDWVYLAYANTLYMEFSVVASAFIALGACVSLLAGERPPSRRLLWLATLALVWLGLTKQQYAPMAALLAVLLAVVMGLRWRRPLPALLFLGIGGVLSLAFAQLNPADGPAMRSVSYANNTNTFLAAVLPSASDQPAALRTLGLPAECLAEIGKNWYHPEARRCPAVADVSRLRLIPLFIEQPATLLIPMYKITVATRPLYPEYLGILEPDAGEPGQDKLRLARLTSLSTYLTRLPERLYVALVGLGLVAGLGGLLLLAPGIREEADIGQRARRTMLALGGFASLYALFSSVFGDGYIEAQKHAVVLGIGGAFQLVAAGWWLVARWPVQQRSARLSTSTP